MKELTVKQKITLEAIEWFINENGYSPTFQELADILECNISTVFKKVLLLEDKGYVSTINGKQRTLKVLKGVCECEV